jgi:glycosyltransferase involved in cell wall biosynthesis
MMHILLFSDSPFATSGYALQAWDFATRAVKAGYQVTYVGTTYHGREHLIDGVRIVGVVGDLMGNQALLPYIQLYHPDLLITFKDPYVYHPDVMKALPIPCAAIVPIDTEPVSEALRSILPHIEYPIALTRYGWQQLQDVGFNSMYVPHGIDTDLFSPGDKLAARAALDLPPNAFVASFVGANQSNPSRKSIDKIIAGFALWLAADYESERQHQDAILYLHTDLSNQRNGIHVGTLLAYTGIPEQNLRVTDQTLYMNGLPNEYLRDLYRASDVLLNPSMGGGFEITCVEAQSCGCPVIASDFTAMRETVWAGWKITPDESALFDSLEYSNELAAYRLRVKPTQVATALKQAYQERFNESLRANARARALDYNAADVFQEYWIPTLKRIAKAELQKVANG